MAQPPDFQRSDQVAVAVAVGVGLGLARGTERWTIQAADPLEALADLHERFEPRWVWWGRQTSDLIAASGIPIEDP